MLYFVSNSALSYLNGDVLMNVISVGTRVWYISLFTHLAYIATVFMGKLRFHHSIEIMYQICMTLPRGKFW